MVSFPVNKYSSFHDWKSLRAFHADWKHTYEVKVNGSPVAPKFEPELILLPGIRTCGNYFRLTHRSALGEYSSSNRLTCGLNFRL